MATVLGFTLVYTVALLAYGLSVESRLTLLYTGINLGLLVLFGLLQVLVRWPPAALWAMSLVGLGNMLGGVLLVRGEPLYMSPVLGSMRYDKVFHAAAAAAMVIIAWEAMKRWSGGIRHFGGQLLLTWLVVMGGGAVVEIGELIGSTISGVSVGDYRNNALDLVANGLGGLVGLGLTWAQERRASVEAVA